MASSSSPPARGVHPPGEELEFSEVPPAIVCAACGRIDCGGCQATVTPPDDSLLPWERDAGFWRRLVDTAILVTEDPEDVFGRLTAERAPRAFTFALSVEALALGSVGIFFLGVLALLVPRFVEEILSSWLGGSVALGVWLAAVIALILVHVIWGVALELGARSAGARPDWARGFRFGMYSCGWDLLTSPAGLILCALFAPRSSSFGLALAAARVPRRAVTAYLSECRALPPRARRRALGTSFFVFGGGFVLFLALLAWSFSIWLGEL